MTLTVYLALEPALCLLKQTIEHFLEEERKMKRMVFVEFFQMMELFFIHLHACDHIRPHPNQNAIVIKIKPLAGVT